MFSKSAVAAVLMLIGCVGSANSEPLPAFNVSYESVGFLGTPSFWLGYAFTADADLRVSELGIFDYKHDGLAEAHNVGLFNSSGSLLSSAEVPGGAGGVLIGDFRYTDVSPVVLTAGETYYLGALYSSNKDEYVYSPTAITGSPLVTYLYGTMGASDTSNGPFDADPLSQNYFGPNLLVSAVPLPASLPLFAAALVGLAVLRIRRSLISA